MSQEDFGQPGSNGWTWLNAKELRQGRMAAHPLSLSVCLSVCLPVCLYHSVSIYSGCSEISRVLKLILNPVIPFRGLIRFNAESRYI